MNAEARPVSPSRRLAPWLLAASAYTTLAVLLTWPLLIRLPSVLPHDLGDPVLNTWILWWNAHAVPLTAEWWNAPIFWPTQGSLALSEHLLGISVLASPLQWMGVTPVSAYNVVFLLSFPLSAIAAHALGYTLTGRHDAAVVAGLAFGFNPYRIAQAPHLQMLTVFGMPAALFALHKYLDQKDRRWLWLFGGACLQQAMSNGYMLVFFPILLALWIAWFAAHENRGAPIAIAGAFVVASLPLLPFLWDYRLVHEALSLHRSFLEIEGFSADAAGLFDASPLMSLWGAVASFHRPEGELYPGLTICLLVVVAVAVWVRRAPVPARPPRWQVMFLTASAACTAVALSVVTFGPWSVGLGTVKLLSAGVAAKPLSLALVFFGCAIAVDPRVRCAASARSSLMFYALATVAMFLLSFGPRPKFLGAPFMYQAPYGWLMMVPGVDSLRVPARFAMVALVCLSAAAAIAFARLTAPFQSRGRGVAAAIVIASILAESWITRMPLPDLPARLRTLETLPPETVVLEIPLGDVDHDTAAVFGSIYHRHRLVNGYSGYAPGEYQILHRALDAGDTSVIDVLASLAPLAVVVQESQDRADRWLKPLAEHPGVTMLAVESGRRIFSVPQSQPLNGAADGQPLRIQSVTANVSPTDAARMIDGDSGSRWETRRAQDGTETVTIDLGESRPVSAIRLSLGPFASDYPRLLAIESSDNGREWIERWRGRTAALALSGALRNPHEVPTELPFPESRARFVRLREMAADPPYHWSIGEISVLGR